MTAGRWHRLALAIALLAQAGTPAARALCAAVCDSSVAHGSHAMAVGGTAHAHAHGHAPHAATADPPPCDDLGVAAVAGTRSTAIAPAPALAVPTSAIARPSARHAPALARARLRPPGGAAAPLPLRI